MHQLNALQMSGEILFKAAAIRASMDFFVDGSLAIPSSVPIEGSSDSDSSSNPWDDTQ